MRREGHLAHLVLRSSLLGKGQNGRDANCQVVSTNIIVLSLLDKRPDVRLLQVVNLVLVCRSKVSAHATVVTSDNDAALASGLDIVHTILGVNTSLVAGLLEDIGVLVLTNTANVHNGVVGEHVLLNCPQSATAQIEERWSTLGIPGHRGRCFVQLRQQ